MGVLVEDVLSALRAMMEIVPVDIGKMLDHPCVLETKTGCCDDTYLFLVRPDPNECSLLMAAELREQPLVLCIVPTDNEVRHPVELWVRADVEEAVSEYLAQKGEEFDIKFVPPKS